MAKERKMVINPERILRVFEEIGRILELKDAESVVMDYKLEDMAKKLENVEKDLQAMREGATYEEIRK